jgi:hypothetical protein
MQEGKKHAHAIVKVKFPTGTIGSNECVALKFHIRTYLRYTDKHQYVQVKPVDSGHSDFECAAGYVCRRSRRVRRGCWVCVARETDREKGRERERE